MFLSLDLTAAFDTIQHTKLLKCLKEIGISGTVLKTFISYLDGRTTLVSLNGQFSNKVNFNTGIPQGGVLSPILYSLYTSDICNILKKHGFSYHIYADDLQIYLEIDHINETYIKNKIQLLMIDIEKYMLNKSLKLNTEKTNIMVFSGKSKPKVENLCLNICGNNIKILNELKILGCTMDNHIELKNHISKIVKKCNYMLHNIYKIRNFLDIESSKILINAMVLSHIDFQIELLYKIPNYELKKLDKILRKSVRLIFNLKKTDSLKTYFQKLDWLPIKERIELRRNKIIHVALISNKPRYIKEMFEKNTSEITRQRNKLQIKRPKSEFQNRALSISGPTTYNKVPENIWSAKSLFNGLKEFYKERMNT